MEGISKDELIEVRKGLLSEGLNTDVIDALITLTVKELQEPWIPLEKFLKSAFVGECWICDHNKLVVTAYYGKDSSFYLSRTSSIAVSSFDIYRVMPIHKPEPPK